MIVDTHGQTVRRLRLDGRESELDWAPKQHQILFASTFHGRSVMSIKPSGRDPALLIAAKGLTHTPAWAEHGYRFAYYSDGPAPHAEAGLWIADRGFVTKFVLPDRSIDSVDW